MKENWVVAAKKADFRQIGEEFHIDPVVARLIRNRDVVGEEAIRKYLYGGPEELYPPELMKGIPEAAALLIAAIREKKKIRVIGDYDIDGVMSSCILLCGLREAGAEADVRIPERIRDGYGLNIHLVEQAVRDGIELIITCDNGIAAAEQIAYAKEKGIQTIVTDHHEVPFEENEDGTVTQILPPADAVVDPKQDACGYPFKGLCGAGVAYKLIEYMVQQRGGAPDLYEKYLELAGFATIGDVMDLVDENRILVREGLQRLRKTTNPGLTELILQNNLVPGDIDVYHVGFVLGPCLNASGRLDTAARALSLLLAKDRAEAAKLAGELIALNASRKEMTAKGEEEAFRQIEMTGLQKDRVLVVFLPEVHESLAGIIAGRCRERYHKPSFVLTRAEEGVKGSGRSIETYSMYEELCKVKHFLTKFGGHPMAAGISLEEENIEAFRSELNACCTLTEEELQPKILIDVPMPLSYLRMDLVKQFDLLKPFGKGNQKPVFAERGVTLRNARVLGKNRNVARLQAVSPDGTVTSAVYFGNADDFVRDISIQSERDIIYYPKVDTWQGRESLQIVITNYR